MILEDIQGRLVYPAHIEAIQITQVHRLPKWESVPEGAELAIVVCGTKIRESVGDRGELIREPYDSVHVLGFYVTEQEAQATKEAVLSMLVTRQSCWGGIAPKGQSCPPRP